jgi:hypothetical protein
MNITKYTVKCCLDKKRQHFVHVTFSHGFGLYGQTSLHSPEDNIEIHGWTFEPHDIELELYPLITRYNLMPLVAEHEMDWVILPKQSL